MPKIDAMLRMMSEKAVERAVLKGDKPYQIHTSGRVVSGSVTTNTQLRELLEEIVTPSMLPNLRAGGASFHFEHPSPHGTFNVGVSNDLGVFEVVLTPAKSSKASVAPAPLSPPPAAPSPLPPATPGPYSVPPQASGSAVIPSAPWPPQPVSAPPVHVPAVPPAPYPGYAPPSPGYPTSHFHAPPVSQRSKVAAGLLAILLPGLGIHRFYLGYAGTGVMFLLLSFVFSWLTCGITAGIAALWSTIEGIMILCGGMKDAEGYPLS